MNTAKPNQISRLETIQWQNIKNNSTFKEIGLPITWSIHYHEGIQQCGLLAQTSRFHKKSLGISCFFLLEPYHTSPSQEKFMNHPRLWKLMANKNMKWRLFLIQGYKIINSNTSFIGVNMMSTNTLCNQLNTIKCHGESERISLMISKQIQGHYLWNSSLEGKVMSWTPILDMVTWWMDFIHMNFHP